MIRQMAAKAAPMALIIAFWLFMSCLALAISDYDFKEALHHAEREAALTRYFLQASLEAVAVAALLLFLDKGRQARVVLSRLASVCSIGALLVFGYNWIVFLPVEDPHYRAFLANLYASRAIRLLLSLSFWSIVLFSGWTALKRVLQTKVSIRMAAYDPVAFRANVSFVLHCGVIWLIVLAAAFLINGLDATDGGILEEDIAHERNAVKKDPGSFYHRERLIFYLQTKSDHSLDEADLAATEAEVKSYLVLAPNEVEMKHFLTHLQAQRDNAKKPLPRNDAARGSSSSRGKPGATTSTR